MTPENRIKIENLSYHNLNTIPSVGDTVFFEPRFSRGFEKGTIHRIDSEVDGIRIH